jgi:hypothetical protein
VVLKRFSGGEKKIIAFYEGNGANEVLVKRLTYDQSGELQLQEDLINNTKLNWLQLHPELKTAHGLDSYLQGDWVNEGVKNRGTSIEKNEKTIIRVHGTDFTHHSVGEYKEVKHEWDKWDRKVLATIKYEKDYFINLLDATNNGKPMELKDKKTQLKIKSMDSFYFDGNDESALFKKISK